MGKLERLVSLIQTKIIYQQLSNLLYFNNYVYYPRNFLLPYYIHDESLIFLFLLFLASLFFYEISILVYDYFIFLKVAIHDLYFTIFVVGIFFSYLFSYLFYF